MAQVELVTGVERRRRWSEDERRALVAAAFGPGAVVRRVARQSDVSTSLLYRWRDELRQSEPGFIPVTVAAAVTTAAAAEPMPIEIFIPGGVKICISGSTSERMVTSIIRAVCA